MRYSWLWLIGVVSVLTACGETRPLVLTPGRTSTPAAAASAVASASPLIGNTPTRTVVAAAAATITPTLPTVVIVVPTIAGATNEARWRSFQQQREVLPERRTYVASERVALLWFNPATGVPVEIGMLRGSFTVQAQFRLRAGEQLAFEVPYFINLDYGLTAISEPLREQMQAAGYTESVEAFVIATDAIRPQT